MKARVYIIWILFSIFCSCNKNQEADLNLKHLNHVAQSLNNDLVKVANDITDLSKDIQYKISFDKNTNSFSTDKYHYYPGQVLFCSYHETQSAVYYPANKNIERIKNIIVNSEQIDPFFKGTINKNPLLAQVYFLDTNSFLRIYPYINVVNYLNSSINLTQLHAYKSFNDKPYNEERAYWLNKPFADPYGRGWVVSCVQPVYYHDKFLAILSGDITLHSIKNKYFGSDSEIMILTDQKANLICCTREASKIFNVPINREYRYYKPVTECIFMYSNPTLTNHENKNFRKAVHSLLAGKNKETFYIDNKKYSIYKSNITETNWLLLKIIN